MPRPREARREQVPTGVITARAIVRSPYFAAGVDEVRRGLPPRFDLPEADRDWAYEVTAQVGQAFFHGRPEIFLDSGISFRFKDFLSRQASQRGEN